MGKRGSARETPPAVALGAAVRFRIVSLCNQRETSAKEFAEREGMKEELASYYFRKLEKEAYLRVSRIKRARGGTQYYYRAIRQALLVDEEFAALVGDKKIGISESTLHEFRLHFLEAEEVGTLRNRGDDHFCCLLYDLDEEGWRGLMPALLWMFKRSFQVEVDSSIRSRRTGEELFPVTIALAGFESPERDRVEGEEEEIFQAFFRRSGLALDSGTLDGRNDSHLTWFSVMVDEDGWKELADDLRCLRRRAFAIRCESAGRLRIRGGAPIHTTFASAGFEAPPVKDKAAVPLVIG
jgi:hypothetical protein